MKTWYIHGLGLIGYETQEEYHSLHYDYRGSTRALSDAQGMVTDRYTYDPYGSLLTHTGTETTPFLYNGRDGVLTESNGLLYMRARYYAPEIRRFINADPLKGSITEIQSTNRYSYVKGNPITGTDPSGLSAEPAKGPSASDIGHLVLGFAGLIPVVGAVFDIANGIWYATEGDYLDAGLSLLTAIPLAGDLLDAGKIAYTGVKITGEAVEAASEASKITKAAKSIRAVGEAEAENSNLVRKNLQVFAKKGGTDAGTELVSYYPSRNEAIAGTGRNMYLMSGDKIDRFGGLKGKYFSTTGTPVEMRAIPYGADLSQYRKFEVVKPFEVEVSTIAPAFNKIGLGTQYHAPVSVEILLKRGIIKNIE